jgi:hypothetical protein
VAEQHRRAPKEQDLSSVVEASQRADVHLVVRGLRVLSRQSERSVDDPLQSLELRLRLARLFGQQTERLVRLADSRPAFLGQIGKSSPLSEHLLGRKALRYAGHIEGYVGQLNKKHEIPFKDAARRPLDPAVTIERLEDETTRPQVLELIAQEDFSTIEQLRDVTGMVKGATSNNLRELGHDFEYLPHALLGASDQRRLVVVGSLSDITEFTFNSVESWLTSATNDLLPPVNTERSE